jgi:hypothetical protein
MPDWPVANALVEQAIPVRTAARTPRGALSAVRDGDDA